ncbi:uncharacterized protein [Branchiostoma lanceolatum]|uniref:uncharacterized protein n=1 Tax=Branchiostoma lanceolatum TaxID=7740 RepID=UPI00345702FD
MSVMGPNEKMLVRSDSTHSLKSEVERQKQEEKDLKERERKERLERLRDEYNFRMGTSIMDRADTGVKRPNAKSFPSHYASPRIVRKPRGNNNQVNGSLSPPPAPRMLVDAAKVNSEPGVLHSMPSSTRKLTRSVSSESKALAVPKKKSPLGSPTRSPSSTSSSPAPPRRTRASTHSEVETDLRRIALERGKGANANTEPRPRVNSMPTQNRAAKGKKTGSLDNLKKSPRGSQASLASSKGSTKGSKDSVSSVEENMAKLSLSSEGAADFPPGITVDGDQVFFTDEDHAAGGGAHDTHHRKHMKKSPIPAQYQGYEVDYQGQFDNVVPSNFNDMLGIHTILSMVSKQE